MVKNFNQFINESNLDIWDKAFDNTTLKTFISNSGKKYLHTCKQCNDIVDYELTDNRQVIGNETQIIAICKECNNPFVIDMSDNYEWFQENKDKIISDNKNLTKSSLNIMVTSIELEGVESENKIDEYFIYTESNESDNYELSSKFNEHYQMNSDYTWVAIFKQPELTSYSNSPSKNYWDENVKNILYTVANSNGIKEIKLY